MTRLPGITNIAYLSATLLSPDITLRALSGVPVGIFTTLTRVSHIGDAVCETETNFNNNSQLSKSTLTFSTTEQLPADCILAFVITTVDGKQFLMGTDNLPFPTIKAATTTGTTDGDKAVTKYTVSYENTVSLVPCYT